MNRIVVLHANLVFTILLAFGALGVWALVAAALKRSPGQLFLSGFAIGALLVIAEVAIGAIMWAWGLRPPQPEVHLIYAAVALASLPLAHRYARNQPARQQSLVYALACLWLCAIALRAIETGRPPGVGHESHELHELQRGVIDVPSL
jgi:heme A synthase